jgi:hypothetical protein
MDDLATAAALSEEMARRHVKTVVQRSRCTGRVSLTFIVTARHGEAELHHAVVALTAAARGRCGSFFDIPSHMEA